MGNCRRYIIHTFGETDTKNKKIDIVGWERICPKCFENPNLFPSLVAGMETCPTYWDKWRLMITFQAVPYILGGFRVIPDDVYGMIIVHVGGTAGVIFYHCHASLSPCLYAEGLDVVGVDGAV